MSDVRIPTVGPWASAVVTVYFDDDPDSAGSRRAIDETIAQDLDRRLLRASRAAAFVWPQTDLVLNLGM